MDITEATYPVFEANQVLTEAHLNDLFEYLDEQNRLTRANLIGIGIVCGLELEFDGTDRIRLTKGCGITSEGYLILEPGVDLVAARPYTVPTDHGYPPFVDATRTPPQQYSLWELLDDVHEAGAVALTDPLLSLDQKAVVLFLELRRDGLRTCAPNNCDDRGTQVTATLRRLLVDVADLDKIIKSADPSHTYLGGDLTERLNLPDLRMPRFDVPNTGPVGTAEVLQAFQEAFRRDKLALATSTALSALYAAFKPLVVDLFPDDPFATSFVNQFGFLDASPATTGQVRFLQYYWDLFDDLLAAYDELRWKGVDLLCACCPPAGLFPRHLMLGVLDPVHHDAADYRHRFIPSAAGGDCVDRSRQVRQLFRRLVAMPATFREAAADRGVQATPSRWGDAAVSAKAIPFYYDQGGTPPLYELWDPVRTARRRANQNLGYRAVEWAPTPPPFVTEPLRYDLEPNNFLRIEGHLGLDVRSALKILASLRRSYRLPFEVVALRTGAFDENMPVDLSKEEYRFRDLETLYDTLKAELICFLVKEVEYFYDLGLPTDALEALVQLPVITLPILARHDPDFRARPNTLGSVIQAALNWPRRELAFPWPVFPGFPDPRQVFGLVAAMSTLADQLTDDLRRLDLAAMTEQYHRLVEIAAQIDGIRRSGGGDAPGLSDRLDDILFACRLDPFEALVEEWKRRIRDAQQAQFLGHFLQTHPGVQHKAGVPLGGTFILVYHQTSRPTVTGQDLIDRVLRLPGERRSVRRTVYSETVAGLVDGTVIADFFLPYLCGPVCATAPYPPPARLPVSTTSTCTDANGEAAVTVTASGATGPVSAQVDGEPFAELTDPLTLRAGQHTLVVRDSAGAESAPVTITIPPTLRITAPNPQVDRAAGTWLMSFTIEGGTPPFVADSGAVADRTFTSSVLPVAQILTVRVKDANGCSVDARFESGVKPCDLPCDGDAVRQGYRFWLPEAQPGFPINEYTADVGSFVVTDAGGNRFDLTAEVGGVVGRALTVTGIPLRSISTADFGPLVERWLRAIDDLVARAVDSAQWMTFEYEAPAGRATTGSLFIDRLQCLDITFHLTVSFVQGQRPRHVELTYSAGATLVVDPDTRGKARIPGFTASTSNKCRPDERPVPLCQGTDLKVAIGREGDGPGPIMLKAVVSGGDRPAAFFWEIQDGIPSLAGNRAVSARFDPVQPAEKLVILTVFTENGCAVTDEEVIDITARG